MFLRHIGHLYLSDLTRGFLLPAMDYIGQVTCVPCHCPAFPSTRQPRGGWGATFPPSLSRLTSKVGLYIQAMLAS